MKTTLLTIVFTILAGIANAQTVTSQDVPQAVLSSYVSQHFAGALDSVWAKKVETIYVVRYQDGDKLFEAQYAEDGSWIKTFAETPKEELLTNCNIGSKINELYPNHQVVKTYVELDKEGKFYVVDLKNDKNLMTVYFTTSGNIYK